MKTRILHWLEEMSTSFWVIPLAMLGIALFTAFFNINLDKTLFSNEKEPISYLFHFNDIVNIRSMLTLTAGSILGVAGVSFSITIASLTLASQQFGPRLLRNFMQHYLNQLVIGIFISTFLYCVLILQFTNSMSVEGFVPVISMITLLALVIVNLLVLVFFIHHTAASMQADAIISDVYEELKSRFEIMFPETDEAVLDDSQKHSDTIPVAQLPDDLAEQFQHKGQGVAAFESGFLQAVDQSTLQGLAEEQDLTIRMNYRPGDFVYKGCNLASCLSGEEISDEIVTGIHNALIIGDRATAEQDAEYSVRQLVEIALRALSPGINDPFTAITCIRKLGDALIFVANRKFPLPHSFDDESRLRLLLKPYTFSGLVEASFNQIRQNTSHHVDIIIALLETLNHLAAAVNDPQHKKAVMAQVEAIQETCINEVEAAMDREAVEQRYQAVLDTLDLDK